MNKRELTAALRTMSRRVADLEEQVERLKGQLAWANARCWAACCKVDALYRKYPHEEPLD